MKKILTIVLLISYLNTNACKCVGSDFIDLFNQASFIAKVKIINFNKLDNSIVNFKIIELLKGDKAGELINFDSTSSCGISLDKNSIWLLLCKKNKDGKLITYYCSGSKQIDIQVDEVKYPNYKIEYQNKIDLTIKIIRLLNKYNKDNNEFNLKIAYNHYETLLDIDNYRVNNQVFSIYELCLNKDLKIKKVKTLRKFDNPELSKKMLKFINSRIIVDKSKIEKIPNKTKLYLVYFFYNGNVNEKSILSFNLL